MNKYLVRFITLLTLSLALNLVVLAETPREISLTTSEQLKALSERLESFERQKLQSIEFSQLNSLWHDLASFEFHEELEAAQLRGHVIRRAKLLIRASKLRSLYLNSNSTGLGISEWIHDSWLELKIIPLRWTTVFTNRVYTVRAYWREGGAGILKLMPDLLALIFILFLPLILKLMIAKVLKLLDKLRLSLVDFRHYHPWREKIALNLQRITPYIPWLLIIMGLDILIEALQGTLVAEVSLLVPYIVYYCYYRLFRHAVLNLLRVLSEKAMVKASLEIRYKMNRSSLLIGRAFFFTMCLLHTVSSVASEGLLYREIVFLAKIVGIAIMYQTVWSWRTETDRILDRHFSDTKLSFLTKWQQGMLFIVAGPISFVIAALMPLVHWLQDQVSELELAKSLAAKIFKKKLESTKELESDVEEILPDDYTRHFSLEAGELEEEDLLVTPRRDPLEKLVAEVTEWREGKSEEHTVAIYGINGAGKTTTLNRLEKRFSGELRVLRADVPAKLLTKSDVFKFCGHLLTGQELPDVVTLLDWDKEFEPTLVILDETQNFFLGRMGGFAGIHAFFELLNARTENIFWCASFNRYCWNYLDQVFSKNRYFRAVYEVEGMNEEDLQSLIMKRHNQSQYRLSFAEIIRALRSYNEVEDTSYVENLFFRMLYQESRGNPRAALGLWLRALKIKRKGVIKVGLPLNPKLTLLASLSDESHFVYAGLMRHENLTSRELVEVTSLAEGVVRYALKIGLENEFVERDDHGRYRLRALMQAPVTQYLKAKNFIYG